MIALPVPLVSRLRLNDLEPISGNDGASVYRGRQDGQPVALKLFARPDASAREADALRRLHEAGAPVPRLIAEEASAILMAWMPGESALALWPRLDQEQRARLAGSMGELLARVHDALPARELAAASFWRRPDQTGLEGFSWPAYLSALIAKWRARVQVGDQDRELGVPAAIAAITHATDGLGEPERITLLHADFSARNVVVDPVTLRATGLIDFGTAIIGDPLYDLAKLAWNDEGADTDALLAGWARGAEVDRARFRLYEAIQGLAAVAWADRRVSAEHDDFRRRGRDVLVRILTPTP